MTVLIFLLFLLSSSISIEKEIEIKQKCTGADNSVQLFNANFFIVEWGKQTLSDLKIFRDGQKVTDIEKK